MTGTDEVAIVIPVYRELVDYERISLQQCLRVLGNYPIVLVTPRSMDVAKYLALWPFIIERFDDAFFAGRTSYSQLLLSREFYQRFMSYAYILIHQLDVFVFFDRLLDFCQKGYDYIGAPVPRWGWPEVKKRIGNGGCSLRKVSSCFDVLVKFPPNRFFESIQRLDKPEDLYFAACTERINLNFQAPPMKKAIEFSVDYERFHCYRKMPRWLPFACHAWQKKLDVWKPIIESFGYHVPELALETRDCAYRDALRGYVFRRLCRQNTSTLLRKIVNAVLQPFHPLAIWGYGKDGRHWMEIIQKAGLPIPLVFDRRAESQKISILRPSKERVKESGRFLLIVSRSYEMEIVKKLCAYGLQEGQDFIGAGQILEAIGVCYYKAVFGSHASQERKR